MADAFQYGSVKPKTYVHVVHVGWVEERNPTFIGICWVSQSLNPTYNYR
ncbi:MAG: hypothetical protein DSM106950_08115 [Stigonema ocellatum SAG 48.90 = DSM 106950]|nr:hypothetical protein [Stigonema ocellatum SAG 48.90 = DSM 106950]